MKNIFKNLGFLLAVATVFMWSCEEEYEAPTAEPNHAYITTSFGGVTNRLQINGDMTFIDLSRGVESRTWMFNAGVTDTAYNAITSSTEQSVKVRFTSTGDHQVKLSQQYAGDVYLANSPSGSTTYDTTITVTVIDSVRASFVAKRLIDMSVLTNANNAMNEVIAGREVEFTFEGTGEPTTFNWTITRGDGFVTTATGNPAVVKFSSLGDYAVKIAASSTLGGDEYELVNYIKVIPSTDPVDLMKMIIDKRDEIRLTYSRDMQNPFNCDPAAFTLNVSNKGTTVPVAISGFSLDPQQSNIVLIELDQPLFNSDVVTLSYNAEVGNLATIDYMDATSFDETRVMFNNVNIMDDNGYDVGFETTASSNWPYLWWGAPWDGYTSEITTAMAHSGTSSLLLDMKPGGGAIFSHRDDAGTDVTFNVGTGLYEVGFWVYVESLGNADTGDGWAPDFRFYPNDWSAELFYGFPANFKVGEWVYMSAEWNSTSARELFFFIRGYNASSTANHKMYIDDLTIFEKEVR